MRVVEVDRIRIERAHRPHETGQHGDRVRVAPESAHEELHLLVHHRVLGHNVDELALLLDVWQFPVEHQVADFEVVAADGELFDRIAAIEQLTFIARCVFRPVLMLCPRPAAGGLRYG